MSVGARALIKVTAREAESPADSAAVRDFMRAYAAEAGVALCFQTLDAELKALPAGFMTVIVGTVGDAPAGCVALKRLADGRAEIVRLYVAPDARHHGLGRALVEAALATAHERGHDTVVLHTLERWRAATALYRAMGFRPTAPYCAVPLEDVLFFARSTPLSP